MVTGSFQQDLSQIPIHTEQQHLEFSHDSDLYNLTDLQTDFRDDRWLCQFSIVRIPL